MTDRKDGHSFSTGWLFINSVENWCKRELVCQPTLIYKIMENSINYLNDIFGFGNFIPDAPVTRYHYIDDRSPEKPRIPRRSRVVIDKNHITDFQRRAVKIVNTNPNITKDDLAKMTKVSSNHAGIVLTALYKANMINRHKITRNHKWVYAYTGKSK